MSQARSIPPSPVSAAAFRRALGQFVTGVTVVTALDANRRPEGVTVNAFASLSLAPPLVLVCLARATRLTPIFESASHFAVNVLADRQRHLSVSFSRADNDRFHAVAWGTWTSGAPILEGCVANLECARIGCHDGGDHVILIGQVERLACDEKRAPLLFARGDYHRLGKEIP
ncbi:MAG: flavin reductase family protein [Pseudomonadota bacterium]